MRSLRSYRHLFGLAFTRELFLVVLRLIFFGVLNAYDDAREVLSTLEALHLFSFSYHWIGHDVIFRVVMLPPRRLLLILPAIIDEVIRTFALRPQFLTILARALLNCHVDDDEHEEDHDKDHPFSVENSLVSVPLARKPR